MSSVQAVSDVLVEPSSDVCDGTSISYRCYQPRTGRMSTKRVLDSLDMCI
jgi:hypothetical protein